MKNSFWSYVGVDDLFAILFLGLGVAGFSDWITSIPGGEIILSLRTEFIGIGITVIIIGNATESMNRHEELKRLILQMSSPNNAFAIEAVRQLRFRRWLINNSMFGAHLRSANLKKANLSSTQLRGVYLRNANLRSANLEYANLRHARLYDANLKKAKLGSANLQKASLSGANLSGADLCGANLSGTYLSFTNLSGANLTRANLRKVDLRLADLSKANLLKAEYDRNTIWPDDWDQEKIDKEGAVFVESWLQKVFSKFFA